MCEKIARANFLRKKDGTAPTPEEIFNYSPTGELASIWGWYRTARLLLGEITVEQMQEELRREAEAIAPHCLEGSGASQPLGVISPPPTPRSP